MDTFVDSSWYFLRYVDPHNDEAPFDRVVVDYWLPVSQYIGGIDHSTGHLLYSRFFVKAMNDFGMLGFREPFARLFHQGWVHARRHEDVEDEGERRWARTTSSPRTAPTRCGSTSSSSGPADQDMEWTETGRRGDRPLPAPAVARRARGRRARRRAGGAAEGALARKANETIAKVTDDVMRRFQFHTPISAVMELVNELSDDADGAGRALRGRDGGVADPAVRAARRRGAVGRARATSGCGSSRGRWPTSRSSCATTFELVVQVNGKVRDRFEVDAGLSRGRARRAREGVARGCRRTSTASRAAKTIVVPDKLVNFVVG